MKNLLYLSLLTIAILFFSCNDDDSTELRLNGTVILDGSSVEMSDGLIRDNGFDDSDSTYSYNFYLANGTVQTEDVFIQSSGGILVGLLLVNPGDSFVPGTFDVSFLLWNERSATVYILQDESFKFATEGTVTVNGSEQSYEITIDADFVDDLTLTGSVEGEFRLEYGSPD
ncbi:MAG: hypothetical protein AAF600_22195 [Bacteroidota bacterium]